MQHLDLDDLARLVDEAPEPAEAEHLRGCLVCRRELAALREQTDALASLGALEPAAGAWAALEARLTEEGLVRTPAPRSRVLMLHRPPVRIAAGVALFLLGAAAGGSLWRGRGVERVAADAPRPADTVSPATPARALGIASPEVVYVTGPDAPVAAPATASGARLAMNGAAAAKPARPAPAIVPRRTAPVRAGRAEADRAARELVEAQAQYVGALQRVAAIADPASGNTPETRLAALDRLVELTAAALERVPGDPVINGYHLAAVAERDALRREIDRNAGTAWF